MPASETQVVYEKRFWKKEGRSRFDMQPEELYKEILAFTLENKSFMENQLRQSSARRAIGRANCSRWTNASSAPYTAHSKNSTMTACSTAGAVS